MLRRLSAELQALVKRLDSTGRADDNVLGYEFESINDHEHARGLAKVKARGLLKK
jgi:hypothetical protein